MSASGAEIDRDTSRKPGRKTRIRSLDDLDRRTTAARSALALRDNILADLGGADRLSSMTHAIVENIAVLGAGLADMAASYLSGDPVDLTEYATLANAQRRLLADIGLERRARDVTPDLRDYIKDRAA